ncbi:uncharacterized protein LOC120452848 isoform X1 [Drosophila santomea]|uniref:uncharacterized protein LOC120452848 isoform X1 n=1 Tax=Drosophila santomea TaxID=129105 RepID=UPI00195313B4|nr:uncharacterized protein LOC120452848 isoform X1 [Drosophila santomea]
MNCWSGVPTLFNFRVHSVRLLKAKHPRIQIQSAAGTDWGLVKVEQGSGTGNLATRNTLDTARAQAPRKDSGFGIRDTVSRARLYRQLRSSPKSVGGSSHRPSLLLLLSAPFAGFRQPFTTHFTT